MAGDSPIHSVSSNNCCTTINKMAYFILLSIYYTIILLISCLYTSSNLPYMNRWNKPATIKQVYPHFFCWIKPANVIQVIGQLQNLPDVGRSLVSFRLCEKFFWNLIISRTTENRPVTCQHQTGCQTDQWPVWCWQVWYRKYSGNL